MLITIYYISKKEFSKIFFLLNYNKIKLSLIIIRTLLYKYLFCCILKFNYIYIILKENNIYNIFFFFKYFFGLNCFQLMDLVIVDRLEFKLYEKKRFSYIYVLLSVLNNLRFLVGGFLYLFEPLISLNKLFSSADWLEREAWDMFGIFFIGHLNLRRILTDYGFIGFPLRKDFPLSGYVELRYDEVSKSIVVEPLELMQEFRFFRLELPWKI
jgi:NADH:ubiquinone oxidoreductase subunit C